MSHDIYLVGSVPLASAEDVFKTVAPLFGDRLKRIPDGETGKRLDWITWLEPVFSQNPALELSNDLFRLHETARPIRPMSSLGRPVFSFVQVAPASVDL